MIGFVLGNRENRRFESRSDIKLWSLILLHICMKGDRMNYELIWTNHEHMKSMTHLVWFDKRLLFIFKDLELYVKKMIIERHLTDWSL